MKIEFDLPNFEKELNINIIIRKDGEVVYSASSSTPSGCNDCGSGVKVLEEKNDIVDNIIKESKPLPNNEPKKKTTTTKATKKSSGNFMDMDF